MSGSVPIVAPLPPINGEIIPPGETEAIASIVDVVERKVREAAAASGGIARRDAHPKGHAAVMAEFVVRDDVPPALRVGLFAAPARYDAWIRFSNGNPTPQSDAEGDARGMAIKLMRVADSPSTTQDFVMINYPVFAVRNVADYLDLENANPLWRFFVPDFNPFHARLKEAMLAHEILSHATNLLNQRYWSMSAYRFGATACKFSARPVGPESPFADTDGPDFLRTNLARHLAGQEAAFDFMVQVRGDPETMPVEDPTVEWKEDAAPFTPVARITIRPQQFDTQAQMTFCENLSFTPWHCVDAHRPLGGLNRLRRAVYERISAVRHELNHVPRKEPADFSIG